MVGQSQEDGRKVTDDGLEITMQSNHFGHFLLTNLLTEQLSKASGGNARVVNTCSDSHMYVELDVDNLNSEKELIPDNVSNCIGC